MTKNSILDELLATRERLLAESGGTVSGLLDRLRVGGLGLREVVAAPPELGRASANRLDSS